MHVWQRGRYRRGTGALRKQSRCGVQKHASDIADSIKVLSSDTPKRSKRLEYSETFAPDIAKHLKSLG